MTTIHSVCIKSNKSQIVLATYLKEFFIFSGVYVEEKILESDKICLTFNNGISDIFIENIMDLSNEEERKKFGKEVLLNKVCNELGEEFKILSKVFIDKDCAYKNYFGRLYFKQMDKEDGKELAEFYEDCFFDLYREGKKHDDFLHIKFAYLNCARKSNEVYDACNIQTAFNEKKLIEEAKKLLEKDETFSIANVLIGEIGLSLRTLWDEGVTYLENAINAEKEKKYSPFIYYRLGHFYEIEKEDLKKAKDIYLEIKKFDSENYRVLFKLGWISYYTGDLEEAVDYFKQVYEQMEQKGTDIQPGEMEYKWKCAFILARSRLLKTYTENTSSYEESINNKMIQENIIIQKFDNKLNRNKYEDYFERKINERGLELVFS